MVVRSAFASAADNITSRLNVAKIARGKHSAAQPFAAEGFALKQGRHILSKGYVSGAVHPSLVTIRNVSGASVLPTGRLGWNNSVASVVSAVSSLLQADSEASIEGSAVSARRACHSASVGAPDCNAENRAILALFVSLFFSIVIIMCLWCHLREGKEDAITPLCPQLMVREGVMKFKVALEASEEGVHVTDIQDNIICRVSTLRPDPLRPGYSGVAATVCLHNDVTGSLATVVARNVSAKGQGLCLCNASNEVFGFVEHDNEGCNYKIRHRSGVTVMALTCDFASGDDIVMTNPVGTKVCVVRHETDSVYAGEVCQHTDAGLMICALFAAFISGQLKATLPLSPWDFAAPRSVYAETGVVAGGSNLPSLISLASDKEKADTFTLSQRPTAEKSVDATVSLTSQS
eukprot:TRINITY_DN469_c0_g1_i1.p1 TRINITY_DN469_c0_g1~~TRINITY_DN469_c0_g1_i1.p1  ORF type:complete len:405 (-),score=45.26 TRINITY_DN469_c0_g1_i1:195-1409(-)